MPIHDWTRVEDGIFHDFHYVWIDELARALNRRLPPDYYAMRDQVAADVGPDVLTLQGPAGKNRDLDDLPQPSSSGVAGVLLAPPKLKPTAETIMEQYRRKKKVVAVRHTSGDHVIAVIEVVSPGNKAARNPLRTFVQKSAKILANGIHLLILDLLPPGKRDPDGIHNEIWQEVAGTEYALPKDRPLTLASYEAGDTLRAYVVQAAVGDALTDMPLFLEPEQAVTVPLEATYQAAFAELPRRWRRVLEAPAAG